MNTQQVEEKKENCPNEAVAIFPWAGKIYRVCPMHLKGLSALNSAVGGVSEPRSLPKGELCEMPNDLEELTPTKGIK